MPETVRIITLRRDSLPNRRVMPDAAHAGHVEIEQRHVGPAPLGERGDRLAAVRGEADNLHALVAREQRGGALAHQPVIVGDQHPHESVFDGHGRSIVGRARTSEQRSIGEVALTSDAPDPGAWGALERWGGSRALVGMGSLDHLAERALDEMREALALDVVVLYLPCLEERLSLQRFIISAGESAGFRPRDDVAFDDEAWGPAVASGAPIVFRDEALNISNPFMPAAQSWLSLARLREAPGGSGGGRRRGAAVGRPHGRDRAGHAR